MSYENTVSNLEYPKEPKIDYYDSEHPIPIPFVNHPLESFRKLDEGYENTPTSWNGDYDPKTFFNQDKEAKSNTDMVNQPPHYTQGGVECIDAIQSAVIGKPPYEAWLTGQIMKYVWRYNFKNGLQDLEKAEFYLKRLITEVREHEPSPVSSL